MRLEIPHLCFLTSAVPVDLYTDGAVTHLDPMVPGRDDPERILVLTWPQVSIFNLRSIPAVSIFDAVDLPDNFPTPVAYDGTQELSGKNVLVMMLNGWGDTILIQPALRALYQRGVSAGGPPRLTVGCTWIRNFPYPGVSYIHRVCPNVMTLKELCGYDLIVNLMPANYGKSARLSLRDRYLELMNMEDARAGAPALRPDPQRVKRMKPVLEGLRAATGKKLLGVNWRSRFSHKDAPAALFFKIVDELAHRYQAVLFKDADTAEGMQREIDEARSSVRNLSSFIRDYHDTTAALSLIDALISVDTGVVHAAGALGVPTVALFGPFPSETHVADYASVIALRAPYRGRRCGGPCLETHRGCAEVDYARDTVSPCLQAVEAGEVVGALEEIVDRCRGGEEYLPGRNRACGF